jgi:hypothetical protein
MAPIWFCPRCKRESANESGAAQCPTCREPVQIQGYCPVCERRWKIAAGQMCPKHEGVLLE